MPPKAQSRRAYSYVRFSTGKQAEGGSQTRQTALSQAYCERKQLTLDDTLTLQDLGVSAFRGDNVREGALAGFLDACRTGRVPRGSVLIVESLDRLSRDQIRPALQLFMAIQDYGITIVTLQPEREYPPDDTDALSLIEPLIVFARAHEESAMKSHRRRDGWKQARDKARAGGGPMMKTCPAWLEVTEDGFSVKKEAAAVVQQIYAMARDGLGVHRITARLNLDEVPAIGAKSRWVKAYVYRILTNPAAMGTYQPQKQAGKRVVPDGEPIPGYYPAIVTEDEWNDAQAAIQRRGGGRGAGRKGADETNLFSGLLYCALTGAKLHIVGGMGRKGDGERKRYRYLTASQETGITSGRLRFDYPTFESAILSALRELRPDDVVDAEPRSTGTEAEITRLSAKLLDLDSRVERAQHRARTTNDFDAYLDLIADLQSQRKQTGDRLAELRELEAGQPANDLHGSQSLIDLLANAPADQLGDLRRRLKNRIRQLVAGIWVVIVPRRGGRLCACQMWFAGNRHRDYFIVHQRGKPLVGSRVLPALPSEIDLRKPKDARKLFKDLARIDRANER